jgi:Flp pilus assembly protein TadG
MQKTFKTVRRKKSEAGQALVFTALGLVVLMGFAGLGIDTGVMRYQRRLQQTAADAAALAGASDLAYGSGVTAGARNAATSNGFTDTSGGSLSSCTSSGAASGTVCVVVNNPPTSGPHTSNSNYVEVLVSKVYPTYFMRVLNINTATVTSRAVATNLSPTNADCLYLLGSTSGLTGRGGSKGGVIAPTCGIVINGSLDTTGSFPVCAGSIGVAGGGSGGGTLGSCSVASPGSGPTCNDQTVSTCPATIPAAANPLGSLTIPTQPPEVPCSGNCFNPGTYTSTISMKGNKSYTFNPGVYVFNGGGVSCSGTPSMTGTGVFFYLENGATFDCSGNSSVSLTAPSSANCPSCPSQFDGILMYQDPKTDQNADTLPGGGNSIPDEGYNGLVVLWGLTVKGNDEVTLGGFAGLGSSGYQNATLVE